MSKIDVKEILDAGVHFGHQASRWNPKMRPFIYGRRNKIHIIDLKETVRGLVRAQRYLQKVASQGSLVLFVGTKRQAAGSIKECAQACGMPYVSERWLGGMLTNYRTIRNRLNRLEELERMQESGELAGFSKKAQSKLMREYRKVNRNLGGIREMNRLPEAIVVVDPTKEHNAVHEAHLLGIKVVALIDTDSNPDLVDLPIPGNDDSMRSIKLITTHLASAVAAGSGFNPGAQGQKEDVSSEEDDMKPVPSL